MIGFCYSIVLTYFSIIMGALIKGKENSSELFSGNRRSVKKLNVKSFWSERPERSLGPHYLWNDIIDYSMILSERSDRSLIVSGYEVKSCPIPVMSVQVAGLLLTLIGRTELVNTDVVAYGEAAFSASYAPILARLKRYLHHLFAIRPGLHLRVV